MTWLLAEIGLSLLLAALVGWYLGWSLRGFREGDRIEDLRQTLAATKDVNDRELAEARRRVDELEARLQRRRKRQQAPRTDAEDSEDSSEHGQPVAGQRPSKAAAGNTGARDAEAAIHPRFAAARDLAPRERDAEPVRSPDATEASPPGGATALPARPAGAVEPLHMAAAERERRRQAERALREKASAVLSLQAELEALRTAVEEKAGEIAQLQDQAAEAETERRRFAELEQTVETLNARARRDDERARRAEEYADRLEAELAQREEVVARRDEEIAALRERIARLEAEWSTERSQAEGKRAAASREAERDLRRQLQLQIERNRKQEAVHRAVVAQLEREKQQLRPRDAGAPLRRSVEDSGEPS